jgi:hypothetical protein
LRKACCLVVVCFGILVVDHSMLLLLCGLSWGTHQRWLAWRNSNSGQTRHAQAGLNRCHAA